MYSGVFSCKVLAFAKSRVVAQAAGTQMVPKKEELGKKDTAGFCSSHRRRRRAADARAETNHAELLRRARLALS